MSSVTQSIKLGGTASDISVGRIAHGLMTMTWVPTPVPDEQCFESIKAGIDALPTGVKAFLNAGEFYAQDLGVANLEMLSRFFAKYPEYADRTFLSVKGGMGQGLQPDSSPEHLRKSVENIERALGPNKKMDLFEPARIDRRFSIEEIMSTLVTLLKEGKFNHISLSEVRAETLRRAHAVYPVAAVEIEVSPWSYEENQKKVISTATELGISVLAYSPIGKGFLTGQIKSPADLPEGDIRRQLTRFKEEIFQQNWAIVEKLSEIAKAKAVTPAQLSIAWVAHLGPTMIPLPGSSKASRTLENLAAGEIKLSDEDLQQINEVINNITVQGDRYWGASDEEAHLWA